jgi:adhesin transport system membrane fusion protein
LLQAMMGNVELVSGELRLDDLSLPQIDLADIRRNATLLTQEARLFHGTLRENLILGRPAATDDEIFSVLTLCGALEFVRKLPLGLEHVIMEGGLGLSGGQRQSLLLARTLLRDPNIILLDEPTSFFDERTEKAFVEQLAQWAGERTMIIATHKAAVLNIVDRILVIQDGQLALDKPKATVFEQEKARGQVVNMSKIPLMADHDPVALLPDSEEDEAKIVKSRRLILLLAVMLLVGGVWAWFAVLDEVSTGTGKVIPSSREQVIQTLDGGILTELNVREGSKVQAGQVVARLDPTRSESNVGESQAKYRASLAASIRLTAEVNNQPLAFPDSLKAWPALLAEETRLYHSRKEQLSKSTRQLDESLKLVNSELAITERLAKTGAASNVEVLRLRQQVADISFKKIDLNTRYFVDAREQLSKANADVASLAEVIKAAPIRSRA